MNDTNRREFLSKAFRIGGLTALYVLGAGAVKDASALGILPSVISDEVVSSPTTWSAWLGKDQEGWGDSANVNICQFDDPDATDDEISSGGGLAGADLTLTEAGGVVGSAVDGSGFTYRQITNADDRFAPTDAYLDLFTGPSFTQIFKFGNLETHHAATLDVITAGVDSAAQNFSLKIFTNDTLMFTYNISYYTTALIPGVLTGNIWIAVWRRIGGTIKFGFATAGGTGAHGQPIKESEFDEVKDTGQASSPTAGAWTDNNFFSTGIQGITAKAYYAIGAKVCLIGA